MFKQKPKENVKFPMGKSFVPGAESVSPQD